MIEYHENSLKIHKITDFNSIETYIYTALPHELETCDYKHGSEVLNIAASFDIEVTSWEEKLFSSSDTIPYATMYIWQFSLNGEVCYGRTYIQFLQLLEGLHKILELSSKRYLLIYVHNLGYEFQFIRNWIQWTKVFAVKTRRPLFARAGGDFEGIEFRCSYLLSNFALKYIGDNLLTRYPVKKLTGNLDYSLIRTWETPLSESELAYCINDVRVVTSYIQEKIENEGGINNIPLTNTGYVRRYTRNQCFYGFQPSPNENVHNFFNTSQCKEYHALMKSLICTSTEEFTLWKDAFAGGFTHASIFHNSHTISTFDFLSDDFEHITSTMCSMDLSSAYPASAVKDYFPMSRGIRIGEIISKDYFRYLNSIYCTISEVTFYDIEENFYYEHYISSHKCIQLINPELDNGRVIKADALTIVLTELDFDIIEKTYSFSSIQVTNCYIYTRGNLPSALITAFLDLYADKTTLKGVDSRYTEYMVKKNMINSGYGMMVTSIVRDLLDYESGWFKEKASADAQQKQLHDYNTSFNRFLFYPWGVYITAHVRHTIWQAILECGEDYVYADTDSVKFKNYSRHKEYFDKFNENITVQLAESAYKTDNQLSKYMPMDKKGKSHPIGVFEKDAEYYAFKTLGAKRYYTLTHYSESLFKFSLTISGVNKKAAIPYLLKHYSIPYTSTEDEPYLIRENHLSYLKPLFQDFNDGLVFPGNATGKLTSRYIDKSFCKIVKDYTGHKTVISERSALNLSPASYVLSISSDLKNLILGIKEEEY